jgi:hypothetical protein
MLLLLLLSSPVVHSCHPSVFVPPCRPVVVVINVPKRFDGCVGRRCGFWAMASLEIKIKPIINEK